MTLLLLLLSFGAQDPVPSDDLWQAFCAGLNAGEGAEARAGAVAIPCAEPSSQFEGPATLESCLNLAGAGRVPECRALLEPEADLAPDALFTADLDTPEARREGWLGVVCAADRLDGNQTPEVCRVEATGRLERSRAARRALVGRGEGRIAWDADLDGPVFTTGFDPARAETLDGLAADAERHRESPRQYERERCRRSSSSRRDEDTGDSEAEYRITCSWSSDPESEGVARRALENLLGD